MVPQSLLALLSLPLITSAHFALNYPASRGSDDEQQATWPCGGHPQTQNRTIVSLTSFPVAVELGHTENLFQIVLALGTEAGEAFNHVLLPTIHEMGPGEFCMPVINVPTDLGIEEGTNATIQVITNAHDGSGLYNCADIQFSATAPESPTACTNGTGISATPLAANEYTNANESISHEEHSESSGAETSATASETAATTTGGEAAASSTPTDFANVQSVGWGLLGAAVLGGVALL